MWRCRGRIQNASVSFSTKNLVLLHQTNFLIILFIQRAHERVMHEWVEATLDCAGEKPCEKYSGTKFEGKPYKAPFPCPLHTFRVEESPPFVHTGVDFAGPLYTKVVDSTIRKVWICLFTCFVTYAVHLDLIADLSTPTFLWWFTARRGLPSNMFSDNGKTFKEAAKTIELIVSHDNVQQCLSGLGIRRPMGVQLT